MESLPVRSRMQELNPESWNFKIDLTEHNYLIRDKCQKGEGNENQIQNSCLENPMDREAWQATVHGVAKSLIQLSN